MAKGDRRHKREEIRRIVAEDERRRKEKEARKNKPRATNYRTDKNGNVILFGNLRFSKLSIAVLLGIVAIGVFFYVVSHGVGEMEGYIEPEFSFTACEADNFEPSMCKFYYKFCKTFADGVDVCEFAIEDPFKDVDDSERKWTEEQQDFLPPTDFILYPFIQYAEARGEDEPSCYSSACKEEHPNLNDDKPDDEKVKTVVEAKKDLDDVKTEIRDLTKQINEWELERIELKNDLRTVESEMEDAEDNYKKAKKDYRHAMDIRVQNDDDIEEQRLAIEELRVATLELKSYQKEYAQEKNRYDKFLDNLREAKNELIYATDSLEDTLRAVSDARIAGNTIKGGDNKFINIVLSKSCLIMIENNLPTSCPTYTELREAWDNTLPRISGEWVETEYDIKRENPKMKNHWKYYESLPNWKIITVDPDAKLMQRGITITIQASDFTYLENMQSHNKTPSYNQTGSIQYQWENVKYHEQCKSVMMAPDLDLLAPIINNLWEGCDSQKPTEIELFFEDMTGENSPNYAYADWLLKAMDRCTTKC